MNRFQLLITSKNVIIVEMIQKVRMSKKEINSEPKHCWEFQNCLNETKSHCIVHELGIEKECWITNRMKPGNPGKMNGSCMNCQWFKKNSPSVANII
jgi:hypothetical protein